MIFRHYSLIEYEVKVFLATQLRSDDPAGCSRDAAVTVRICKKQRVYQFCYVFECLE